ncbi:MAG TPA: hypothetical protein VKV74_08950 [Bryobacteraceae bacterium]|nr:hypothetical protein [Bryobacteraceae bacterium]
MIEVIVTAAMLIGSVFLFGYWFRYTCLLILSTKTARDYAAAMAQAHELGFLDVQARLRACAIANLKRLHESLDRDYAVVRQLLESANPTQQQRDLEMRMLQLNYCILSGWARLCRRFSRSAACRALEEMSQVVAHFANAMGEMSAASAAA